MQVEVLGATPAVGKDQKVGSHPPPEEGEGPCLLPNRTSFDDMPREDLF